MNPTTVTFWKPSLVISAEPSGLFVAVKASEPAGTKPAQQPAKAPRPN